MQPTSLLIHPDETITARTLTTEELAHPSTVLGCETADVMYLEAGAALWVDENYLDRDREEFNAGATFLSREHGFQVLSLRGPALLCAINDDGSIDNLSADAATALQAALHRLLTT
ncbi:DUF3846 domain-containing protein [Nocardiopsis synnemataformans]|uniref:DUF3846 domain-containing protein n=1 Tax=Nocardiopsis synnemataformans TaxID=61305 RepID=UPI003EC07A6B